MKGRKALGEAFSSGLVVPAVCLAALGWTVPRVLALFWPEGVRWLMGLALVSTVAMVCAGAGFFAVLYAVQGVNVGNLYGTHGLGTFVHFGKLGLISGLLWAPLMVLSVAGVPKNWVREVW